MKKEFYRGTLADQAYQHIHEMILYNQLPPGSSIQEKVLAKEMQTSITPVREALNRLERDGLVQKTPWVGTIVSSFSIDEIRALYDIRVMLEALALRKAFANLTIQDLTDLQNIQKQLVIESEAGDILAVDQQNREFHSVILRRAGSKWLTQILSGLQDVLFMLRFPVTKLRGGSQTHDEHLAVTAALKEGDLESAISHLEGHIRRVRDDVIKYYCDKDSG